jgi:hypothetical protein
MMILVMVLRGVKILKKVQKSITSDEDLRNLKEQAILNGESFFFPFFDPTTHTLHN